MYHKTNAENILSVVRFINFDKQHLKLKSLHLSKVFKNLYF